MPSKTWVIAGGIFGIITCARIGQLVMIVRRYPALRTAPSSSSRGWGSLLIEYLEGHTAISVNKWMSFGLIVLIFLPRIYTRRQGGAGQGQTQSTDGGFRTDGKPGQC